MKLHWPEYLMEAAELGIFMVSACFFGVVLEYPSSNGPYGVKGVGEMTANSPIPAIVNAIYDAVGVWVTDLPVTPEKVLRAIEANATA